MIVDIDLSQGKLSFKTYHLIQYKRMIWIRTSAL